MELVLSKEFAGLTDAEMLLSNGGDGVDAAQAFFGTVIISVAPAVGVGVRMVATPIAGGFAAASLVGFGMTLLGPACH